MTREELKNYRFLKVRIQSKIDDYEERFSKVNKITQTIDGMPKAHNKPNYSLEELIDSSKEIIELLNEDLKKEKEIVNQLKLLDDKYQTILTLRYIQGKTLEEVSTAINYSYNETCKLNGQALIEFDKLHKNA